MKNPTIIERKSDRKLIVTRTFDAPARVIFQAWSKPELFRRWWLPKSMGMTLISYEADIRTGGSYRLEISYQGSKPMAVYGKYLKVTPHSRMVWTNEESPDGPVTTVTLEEKRGKTLLVLSELHPSKAALDAAGTGALEAMPETFGQLDELAADLIAGG
jgi:uncharacterized protein YndB with AHSA1/START domain